LDADIVQTYLNDNPEFLDHYVAIHVTQESIEKWLQAKRGYNKIYEETINGDVNYSSCQ